MADRVKVRSAAPVSAGFMLSRMPKRPPTMREWAEALIEAWRRQLDKIDMAALSLFQRAHTRLAHSYFPPAHAIAATSTVDNQVRTFYGRIGATAAAFQRQLWERLELVQELDGGRGGYPVISQATALKTGRRIHRGRAIWLCAPRSMQLKKTFMAEQFFLSPQHRFSSAPERLSQDLVRENPLSLVALPLLALPVPHPLTPVQWGYAELGGIDELSNEGALTHPSMLLQEEKKKPATGRCAKTFLLEQLVISSVATLVFYDFHSVHLGSQYLTDFWEFLNAVCELGINVVLCTTAAIHYAYRGGTFFHLFGSRPNEVPAHDLTRAADLAKRYWDLLELRAAMPAACVDIVTHLAGQSLWIEEAFVDLAERIIDGKEPPKVAAAEVRDEAVLDRVDFLGVRARLDNGDTVSSETLHEWADWLEWADLD